MSDKSNDGDPVGELAESFVERYRRGERPPLTEYTDRYPEHADRIRELFPALVIMEELAPEAAESVISSVTPRGSLPRGSCGERLEQVGDYRILREIGRGGMGVVYEAEQLSLGRHVALKVLPIHAAKDAKSLERFRREARAAARLHHTNIVPVFEVGQDHDVCFYAMQFIQGQGLDEVLVELQRIRALKESSDVVQNAGATSVRVQSAHALAHANSAAGVAEALVTGHFHARGEHEGTQARIASEGSENASAGARSQINDPRSRVGFVSDNSTDSATTPHSSATLTGHANLSSVSESNPQHFYRSVARIGVDVAEALEYAHGHSVVHRDIKPSNLLLDAAGTVWVTDFGLAKTQASDLTHTGDLVGTLRYMAPERFRGHSDSRSDVYGLGVTLYELLTLEPAFDSPDRMRLIQQVTHAEPVRPRKRDPRIPRDLETIVIKAIDKEPERRYGSAIDMAEDLRRFLADRPIQARRSAVWERTWRLFRRNPWLAGLSAAVALLVMMVFVISLVAAVRLGAERDATRGQLSLTQEAEASAKHRLYRTTVNQAHAVRLSGQLGARADSLRLLDDATRMARELELPPEDFQELRNEVIASLALMDLRRGKQWPGYSVDTITVAFTPNLDRYARAKRDGSISVRRVPDDAELFRIDRAHRPDARMTLAFSPDGRFLAAFDYTQRLAVWDLDRNQRVMIDSACRFERAYAFSPDSQSIASGHQNEILLYDLETGSVSQRWPTPIKPYAMAFHPDGDRLAVSAGGPSWVVQIQEVGTGRLMTELPATSPAFNLTWHPNRTWLAVSLQTSTLTIWDVTTGKRHLVFEDIAGSSVAFSHSGTLMATGGWGALQLWNPQTGRQLFSMIMPAIDVRFSLDDRRIAATYEPRNDMLGFLDLGTNDVYRLMGRVPQDPTAVSGGAEFDATGQVLAVGYRNGFGLWDISSGDELAFLPAGAANTLIREPSGSILTGDVTGVFRWPLRRDQTPPDTLHIGPPERLPISGTARIGIDRAGRLLAMPNFNGGEVRFMDRLEQPLKFGPHYDSRYLAVSPDGRWVATGSHWGTQVKIWEVSPDRVQHAKTLPIERMSGVNFSPDGRWLATAGHGMQLWHVPAGDESAEAWRQGPEFDGSSLAFSPDGTTLALQTWYDTPSVRIVDFESRRELARLTDPFQHRGAITFSSDSTRLVAVGDLTASAIASVRVWDLRRLREQLAERGLDWDRPPYPVPSAAKLPPVRRVTVDLGELASGDDTKLPLEERMRGIIANNRRAFEANPSDPLACNNLAWYLAIAPEPLREIEFAVTLAEKAVAGTSDPVRMATYRNTLGVAYYRAGRFCDAIACLEKNLADQSDIDLPYDLYFLAMSHEQLGDTTRARELLTWANRWIDSRADKDALRPDQITEFAAFRVEAEAVVQRSILPSKD